MAKSNDVPPIDVAEFLKYSKSMLQSLERLANSADLRMFAHLLSLTVAEADMLSRGLFHANDESAACGASATDGAESST